MEKEGDGGGHKSGGTGMWELRTARGLPPPELAKVDLDLWHSLGNPNFRGRLSSITIKHSECIHTHPPSTLAFLFPLPYPARSLSFLSILPLSSSPFPSQSLCTLPFQLFLSTFTSQLLPSFSLPFLFFASLHPPSHFSHSQYSSTCIASYPPLSLLFPVQEPRGVPHHRRHLRRDFRVRHRLGHDLGRLQLEA